MKDTTLEKLLARQKTDARIKIVDLIRNFCKEAALSAGIATFFLLPLVVTSWDKLLYQYGEWYTLMLNKSSTNYGFSFLRVLQLTIGEGFSKLGVQFAAALTYALIFWYCRKSTFKQRVYGFAMLCYFYVLFNHQVEGPTFVIPMVAFALHQTVIQNQRLRLALVACYFCAEIVRLSE